MSAQRTFPHFARISEVGSILDAFPDGTDQTSNILRSIDRLRVNGGGLMMVPPGAYRHDSPINLDDVRDAPIHMMGMGGLWSASPSRFYYTGGAGAPPGWSLKSAQGHTFSDLGKLYTHPAFDGELITGGHTASGVDTAFINWQRCLFGSLLPGSKLARSLVNLNFSIICSIRDCIAGYGKNVVRGHDGGFSVRHTIDNLTVNLGRIGEAVIRNPNECWAVNHCTIEAGDGGVAKPGVLLDAGKTCWSLEYNNNWHGDVFANGGNWFRVLGLLLGAEIACNRFTTPGSAGTESSIRFESGSEGIGIRGSRFEGPIGIEFLVDFIRAPVIVNNDFQTTVSEIVGMQHTLRPLLSNDTQASSSVAAADTLVLPDGHDIITVTGNTNIASGIAGSWRQRRVTLIFTGTPTVTDGANLRLNGNFVATADDTLTLVFDGNAWFEQSRSVN